MRKKYAVFLTCATALLVTLLVPTLITEASWGHQGRIPAWGTWVFYPEHKDLKFGEDYTFILGNETGEWTGTFTGTDYAIFFAEKNPEGDFVYLPYGVIFFEGEVEGKEGTCRINFGPAEKKGSPMLWSGPWQVLDGTGELENLTGEGIWWEITPTHIEYYGWVRFHDVSRGSNNPQD